MGFKKKVAIVTGGRKWFGKPAALAYSAQGVAVVLVFDESSSVVATAGDAFGASPVI